MKSITFAVSKGGVGKSLVTANVGAALAGKDGKVVLVEGDPNKPLQTIFGLEIPAEGVKLDEVVKRNLKIEEAVYSTEVENLFLIPSGVSLRGYFDMDPINFARKLAKLEADFVFIDAPFPLGEAAFLSLGVSEYFIVLLTEDEFVLCVESAIDTLRLARYLLKCVPLGFILNRIKTPKRFTNNLIGDLEDLLEIPCIAQITEDPRVSKSYGGVGSREAFLAYQKLAGSEFTKSVDKVATRLLSELPRPEKRDPVDLLRQIVAR